MWSSEGGAHLERLHGPALIAVDVSLALHLRHTRGETQAGPRGWLCTAAIQGRLRGSMTYSGHSPIDQAGALHVSSKRNRGPPAC